MKRLLPEMKRTLHKGLRTKDSAWQGLHIYPKDPSIVEEKERIPMGLFLACRELWLLRSIWSKIVVDFGEEPHAPHNKSCRSGPD